MVHDQAVGPQSFQQRLASAVVFHQQQPHPPSLPRAMAPWAFPAAIRARWTFLGQVAPAWAGAPYDSGAGGRQAVELHHRLSNSSTGQCERVSPQRSRSPALAAGSVPPSEHQGAQYQAGRAQKPVRPPLGRHRHPVAVGPGEPARTQTYQIGDARGGAGRQRCPLSADPMTAAGGGSDRGRTHLEWCLSNSTSPFSNRCSVYRIGGELHRGRRR